MDSGRRAAAQPQSVEFHLPNLWYERIVVMVITDEEPVAFVTIPNADRPISQSDPHRPPVRSALNVLEA